MKTMTLDLRNTELKRISKNFCWMQDDNMTRDTGKEGVKSFVGLPL